MAEHHHQDLEKTNSLLKEALLHLMPNPGSFQTEIKGLTISRFDAPTGVQRCFYTPLVLVVVQGRKHSFWGADEFVYGEKKCVITGVDLPYNGRILDASPDKPYLSIRLTLDQTQLAELLATLPPIKIDEPVNRGMVVGDVDPAVLDALLRVADLLEQPAQQAVLAPLVIREIHYRLLLGPLGNQLRMIHTQGSQSNQVARVITWLKSNYKKPLNVIELAKQVNMASSTFHRHFRKLTSLSPLQYQKRLRLSEAQRLMLVDRHDAGSAGYAVGYESLTQFNREYKRMFGAPPRQDVQRILHQ
ncbi:MAG: AraC family transcriptional regulator [Treponema sp.]|nr:AraC family transcriptional regulator [Treponema sp.]